MDPEASLLKSLTELTGVSPRQFGEKALQSLIRQALESATDRNKLLGCEGAEWLALVESVMVPETWFFRNPEAFSAFGSWLNSRPPGHPTRVLCLPCATGEEAYSIAITALNRGFDPAKLSIIAGDLSTDALASARAAIYGKHAFRTASHLMAESRYFDRIGDAKWRVSDLVRKAVSFTKINLIGSDALPQADAIFCRNALIYFSKDMQAYALERLRGALSDNGILFLGSVELPIAERHGFLQANYPMAFACQKRSEPTVNPEPRPRDQNPRKVGLIKRAQDKPAVFADWRIHRPDGESVDRARELADAGRHAEAASALDALIAADEADADTFCLAAIVREAIGDADRAEALYRKALYLDPGHTEAMLHLALLLESGGRSVAASPLRQRAKRLIDS